MYIHRSDKRGGWSCQRLQIASYIYFLGLMYRYEFCNLPFHCYFSFSSGCSSPKFRIKFEAPVLVISYFVFGVKFLTCYGHTYLHIEHNSMTYQNWHAIIVYMNVHSNAHELSTHVIYIYSTLNLSELTVLLDI